MMTTAHRNATPEHDDQASVIQGRKLALEFIQGLRSGRISPFALADRVNSFPDQLSGLERGFLSELCRCLSR